MIDVLKPNSFSKWALLLLHNTKRSDDLFAYVPAWRKVTRVSAIDLETQVLFQLLSLGEFRPITAGKLDYSSLPDAVGSDSIASSSRSRARAGWHCKVATTVKETRFVGFWCHQRIYANTETVCFPSY